MIHYLCSDHTPTARQTDEGVALLADQLQDHGLTKAEVLQLCNLAPTLPVELYCVSDGAELFNTFTNARLDCPPFCRASPLDYRPKRRSVECTKSRRAPIRGMYEVSSSFNHIIPNPIRGGFARPDDRYIPC